MKAKPRRVSPEQRRKQFKPTLFFGYGSLMRPEGIYGKGLNHRYTEDELIPVQLYGFKRSMCGYWGGRNFYGLMEDKKAHCNGALFKIHSWDDYRRLLINEGATASYGRTRVYWPTDVVANVKAKKMPKDHRVIALVCRNDGTGKGKIPVSYIRLCWMFAEKWGDEFAKEFLRTGGIRYDKTKLLKLRREGKLNIW